MILVCGQGREAREVREGGEGGERGKEKDQLGKCVLQNPVSLTKGGSNVWEHLDTSARHQL